MARREPVSILEHYERSLGEIEHGWRDGEEHHGIHVVSFASQPGPGVRTFATLGLSDHVLQLPRARQVRQELLTSVNEATAGDQVADLILSLAEGALQRGRAILRGEVIALGQPAVPGSRLTCAYMTNPSSFNETLVRFVSDSPPTVFGSVIAITPGEAALVRERGWNWFEDELAQHHPDTCDLYRTVEITPRD
ncbi:MAG: suppressor of fused domain protein [Steroidobacteraceae bacterium]